MCLKEIGLHAQNILTIISWGQLTLDIQILVKKLETIVDKNCYKFEAVNFIETYSQSMG